MKIRTVLASTAALAVAAGIVAPSAHAIGDSTGVTVTLNGGSLTLDAPDTATGEGTLAPLATISVSLSNSTVNDARGSLAGWSVTATSTALTGSGTATGSSIPAANMLWTTGTLAVPSSGGNPLGILSQVALGLGGSLAAAAPVATAAVTGGGGTYNYPATVAVTVPVNAKAGAYAGTITQTII